MVKLSSVFVIDILILPILVYVIFKIIPFWLLSDVRHKLMTDSVISKILIYCSLLYYAIVSELIFNYNVTFIV